VTAVVDVTARVLDIPESAESRAAWTQWLTDRLEPGWRPGEWNPQTWFFDGDPANEFTAAGLCEVSSCGVKTDGPRMCAVCQKAFQVSTVSREQFVATHDSTRKRKIPNGAADRCVVTLDGTRCAAPAHCMGLCHSHYSSFRYVARTKGRSLQDWLPRAHPYSDARPECLVIGCGELVAGRQELCQYHRGRYLVDCRKRATRLVQKEWAQQEVPFLRAGQFSLNTLHPLVRLELLYSLQRRAARGGVIQPKTMRLVVNHVRERDHLVGVSAAQIAGENWQTSNELTVMAKEIERWLTDGHEEMVGVDPRDRLVWDLRQLNLHANPDVTQIRRAKGTLDFTVISQSWLRELTMQYCATFTSTANIHRTVLVAKTASMTMEVLPGGGHSPAELGPAHLDAITAAFRSWKTADGLPRAQNNRHDGLHTFFLLLGFGRRTGLMDAVPSVFTPDPRVHRIKTVQHGDDEVGRAIPEPVITQLDRHLHLLRCPVIYRGWTREQMDLMFRTLYIVLRDTGRRPREACSLRVDCIEHATDGALLIWDNHKSGRRNRRLPITAATAQALTDWQQVRAGLTTGDIRDRYLFPARTLGVPDPFFMTQNLTDGIRIWVHEHIPELLDDSVNQDGQRRPFDRKRIYPYAFRHSYAQRHADAGVPIDVLRDLMDHQQTSTTQGYYRVTQKRKRDAIRTLHRQVIDRTGNSAPTPSQTAYELRSVAAPFGNCIEPSNVKAGGGACPIRFQCSGCGFYRADPSYIPAIEDHVQALRADRELASAMDVDDFVIRNLTDQITSYQNVLDSMRTKLATFDEEQRNEVEQAAAVLRKVRAGAGRIQLPITAVAPRPAP